MRSSRLVRQLALGAVQTLARLFAPSAPNKPALLAAAPAVVGCLEREDGVVGAAAATCTATLVVHLGVAMLPHVNKSLPRMLALLPPALEAFAPAGAKAARRPLAGAARDAALASTAALVAAVHRVVAAIPGLLPPRPLPALSPPLSLVRPKTPLLRRETLCGPRVCPRRG